MPDRDRLALLLPREAREGLRRVDVVRDQHAALAEPRPRARELEPHAVERVLAVVHEGVDRTQALEQRRELVLAAAEPERPALAQVLGDEPAGMLSGGMPAFPVPS